MVVDRIDWSSEYGDRKKKKLVAIHLKNVRIVWLIQQKKEEEKKSSQIKAIRKRVDNEEVLLCAYYIIRIIFLQ